MREESGAKKIVVPQKNISPIGNCCLANTFIAENVVICGEFIEEMFSSREEKVKIVKVLYIQKRDFNEKNLYFMN